MNFKKIVEIGTSISIFAALSILIVLLLKKGISPFLIKLGAFSLFTSLIFCLNFILEVFCYTSSNKIKKLIFYIGYGLVLLSALILFNFISFDGNWHLITSFGILYLIAIELHLNGWEAKKQTLNLKIIFAITLIANLFIATVLFFKLPYSSFQFPLYTAGFISLSILFYGLYFYQPKHKIKAV